METSEQIIKTIAHEIKYKRDDNFLNHLKTYFQLDPVHYSGTYTENSFTIWRYSKLQGLFYVVVSGHVFFKDNKTKVDLKTRPNIVGLFLALIIFTVCPSIKLKQVFAAVKNNCLYQPNYCSATP